MRSAAPLFRNAHKQRARQFAVVTHERRVIGLVVVTKKGRLPGIRVLFDEGFVGRALMIKFRIGGGLSIFHQRCFGSDEVLTS
jgi:hypothetical protein